MVGQIEEWASAQESTWVEIPDVWSVFPSSITPGNLTKNLAPVCFSTSADLCVHEVGRNHGSYMVRRPMEQFGIKASQSRARHSFVEHIAVDEGIRVWDPPLGAVLVCGYGKTEHDIRDFTYLAYANHFTYWVFMIPPHIDISAISVAH